MDILAMKLRFLIQLCEEDPMNITKGVEDQIISIIRDGDIIRFLKDSLIFLEKVESPTQE